MIFSAPPATGSLARTFFPRDVAPDGRTSTGHPAIANGVDAVSACGKKHGIVQSHLSILANLAEEHDVVFAFRPVNALATQLLEQGYPTKDLNIKGKSADWGPMAGFIPVSQELSKLVGDGKAIKKSNGQIQECIDEMHAVSTPLVINEARLRSLCQAGVIRTREKIGLNSIDIFSEKNGQHVAFQGKLSFINQVSHYEILHKNEPVKVLAKSDPATKLTRPLTADYNLLLFAVPLGRFNNNDNLNSPKVSKPVRQPLLMQMFKNNLGPPPANPVESDVNKTSRQEPPSLRIDIDAADSVSNRGGISPRLNAFIPAISTA